MASFDIYLINVRNIVVLMIFFRDTSLTCFLIMNEMQEPPM